MVNSLRTGERVLSVPEVISIAALGDMFPNDRFYNAGQPIVAGFRDTLEVLASADLRLGSFLMPLSNRGEPTEKLSHIHASPAIAQDLAHLQLDAVSLANNHIFDYGPLGLYDTQAALASIGVGSLGAGRNLDEATAPLYFERKGRRIGVVAYSCLVPPGAAARPDRPGIATIRVQSGFDIDAQWALEEPGEPEMIRIRTWTDKDEESRALEQLRSMRNEVEMLCVSVHWGYGASEQLAEYVRPLGHVFVDAGADVVFGHHVHAPQGVEVYRGKPIFYSPASFVGRQQAEDPALLSELAARLIAAMSDDGYISLVEFDEGGVSAVELVPTVLERGLPVIGRGDVARRVIDRVMRLSQPLGTEFEVRGDRVAVIL